MQEPVWRCGIAGRENPPPPASAHNGNAISKDHGSALATENTITFMTKHITRAMRMTRRPSPRHEIITGIMKLPAILRTPSKTYVNPMMPVPYPATSRKRSPISVKMPMPPPSPKPIAIRAPKAPGTSKGALGLGFVITTTECDCGLITNVSAAKGTAARPSAIKATRQENSAVSSAPNQDS